MLKKMRKDAKKNPGKFSITSDVKNRLRKIRQGIVYNDIFAVIDELVQNSYRAGATKVNITIIGDTFVINDNGNGCDNPKVLFTLDFSGFGNGFGEGFTSIYMIADSFVVKTNGWKGYLNIKEVLDENKGNLDVEIENALEHYSGFHLELTGEKIREHSYGLIDYVKNAVSIIPNIDFVVNGEAVPKKDIFDIAKTSRYTGKFNNRKYEASFSLTNSYRDAYIKVYFEHRYVTDIAVNGLSGSLLLKANAVNLRTPDRRGIIYDYKERELQRKISKDAKSIIKEMIKSGNGEDLKTFSEIINYYMEVDEYIQYLTVDSGSIMNQYELRDNKQEKNTSKVPLQKMAEPVSYEEDEDVLEPEMTGEGQLSFDEESFAVAASLSSGVRNYAAATQTTSDTSLASSIKIKAPVLEADQPLEQEEIKEAEPKRDTKRNQPDKQMTSFVGEDRKGSFVKKSEIQKISIKDMKKKKNVIWVEKEREDEFSSLIAKYEYYGVFTFVSPHILYDNALRHMEIPHISDVEKQAVQKDYKVTKIGARNKKEERVMELLGFIEKTLNIGETFNISTIDCNMMVNLRGTRIYKEKLHITGYAQGRQIHLNRKDLNFGHISSLQLGKNTLSIHDVKFILGNLDVIAHELAHVIYSTADNTKQHFEKQLVIQNQIANAVMEANEIW